MISTLVTTLAGILVLSVILFVVLRAIWNVLEIAYRVTMVFVYGTAYIAITAWEVLAWIVLLPIRLIRWLSGFFHSK